MKPSDEVLDGGHVKPKGRLAAPPFSGLSCLGEQLGPVPVAGVPEHADRVMVRSHDGVRLATDLYMPDRSRRRCAAVLVRLPYDKAGDHAWIPDVAACLVSDGYVVVAQDVRGKGGSDGELRAFVHEAADGAATLDWIVAQRWSNGRIGMFGQSYYGFTQWAAASTGHPALRCIVPQMTASDIGAEWMYRGGVFELQTMAEWAAWAWIERRMVVHDIDWRALPVDSLVHRWTGADSASYRTWLSRGPRSRFWNSLYPSGPRFGKLRAAVLGVGGFWDVFQRGQIRDLAAVRRQRPAATMGLHLGAQDHYGSEWTPPGTPSPDYEGDPALKDQALERYLGPAPAWFHTWLKTDTPGKRAPGVRFQVAGEGWRTSASWPPEGRRRTSLFLNGDALTGTAARRASRTIPFDPEEPVPSLDDNPWQVLLDPSDRSELASRGDVRVFDTEPLSAPQVLAGRATLALTASAHGGARTLHATLVDVWPDGAARRLAGGVAMLGTAPRRIVMDLGHACLRMEPGRRLRLELAASDFPRHPRAAGTGSPLTATRLFPGELRVRLDATAVLSIGVIPA